MREAGNKLLQQTDKVYTRRPNLSRPTQISTVYQNKMIRYVFPLINLTAHRRSTVGNGYNFKGVNCFLSFRHCVEISSIDSRSPGSGGAWVIRMQRWLFLRIWGFSLWKGQKRAETLYFDPWSQADFASPNPSIAASLASSRVRRRQLAGRKSACFCCSDVFTHTGPAAVPLHSMRRDSTLISPLRLPGGIATVRVQNNTIRGWVKASHWVSMIAPNWTVCSSVHLMCF